MFSGIRNETLYAAYRIKAQFKLRDVELAEVRSGTAFFVRAHNGTHYLFTNRHLLDAGYNQPSGKYLGAELTGVLIEGLSASNADVTLVPQDPVAFEIISPSTSLKFAANYFEDVACFVEPKVSVVKGLDATVHFHLNQSELADDSWLETQLRVCDFVAFPGFPPWFDRAANRPILRTGTISSDPRTNYSDALTFKGRRVAYEAFSFGGSSGSPVIAPERGFRGGPGIQVSGFREAKIVGINAGHFTGDHGVHSGVSYFIKSSAILDLIE